MSFPLLDDNFTITVEGPTEDPSISSPGATLFNGISRPLYNDFLGLGMHDPSSPASSFFSTPPTPALLLLSSPDDTQVNSDFDDRQFSPISPNPQSPVLFDFDNLVISDVYSQPSPIFREQHFVDVATVAPQDVLGHYDGFTSTQTTYGPPIDSLIFDGVESPHDPLTTFSEGSGSSALFSAEYVPIASPSDSCPVSLQVHDGPLQLQIEESLPPSAISATLSPLLSPNSPSEHLFSGDNYAATDESSQSYWFKRRGRAASSSSLSSSRLSPYSRNSPKLGDEEPGANLFRHASDPLPKSRTSNTVVTRMKKEKNNKHPTPPSGSDTYTIGGEALVKQRVASDKCRAASEQRRKKGPQFFCKVPGCGGSFTAKHNLNYHLKSHKGEMNYPCSVCGEAFVTLCTARRHEKGCVALL